MVPPERHPDAPDWTTEVALELVRRPAHGRPVTYVDCEAYSRAGHPRELIPPDPTGWSYTHGFPDDWVRVEVGPLT